MELSEAREIIKLLADGVNPLNGEVFDQNSPYCQPQIIRALYTTLYELDRSTQSSKRPKKNLPEKAGQSWSEEEEISLITAFDEGTSIKDLAQIHQRTEGAISSRLMKLGKLQFNP
jgi:hypothetical protein